MTALIDYDAGNIRSVEKAFAYLGEQAEITRDPDRILQADRVVLPGVGAFGSAMERLNAYGLTAVIREVVNKKQPFLGICLGLQLMFEESEESPGAEGLCLFPGKIKRIPPLPGLKVPHIGWNDLTFPRPGRLFAGMEGQPYVYFVHSFYLSADADETGLVTAKTQYGDAAIGAAVERDNLFACQFHPEKSSDVGMRILENFLKV